MSIKVFESKSNPNADRNKADFSNRRVGIVIVTLAFVFPLIGMNFPYIFAAGTTYYEEAEAELSHIYSHIKLADLILIRVESSFSSLEEGRPPLPKYYKKQSDGTRPEAAFHESS